MVAILHLTKRQQEVKDFYESGMDTATIAKKMNVAQLTVQQYLCAIRRKIRDHEVQCAFKDAKERDSKLRKPGLYMPNMNTDPKSVRALMRVNQTFADVANPNPERTLARIADLMMSRDGGKEEAGPLDAFIDAQILEKPGLRIYLREITPNLAGYQCHSREIENIKIGEYFRQLALNDLDGNGVFLDGQVYTLTIDRDLLAESDTTFFIPWANVLSLEAMETGGLYFVAV